MTERSQTFNISVMFLLEIIILADSISMYLVANIIAKEHISFISLNANYPVTVCLQLLEQLQMGLRTDKFSSGRQSVSVSTESAVSCWIF